MKQKIDMNMILLYNMNALISEKCLGVLKYNNHNKMGCGASTNANSAELDISQPEGTTRYIRKQMIGKGTYGQVYKCIDTKDNKEYAMKVIKINSKTRNQAVKQIAQLKSQISMLKKLNHPFIVKYESFDVTPTLDQVQIVMQLVRPGTLRQYIQKNGSLTEMLCAEISAKILEALAYLHAQSIIHRDLKCANILLTDDLIPKLTDFGTAKVIPQTDHDDIAKLSASLKGTPFYMAPQVLKRSGHNHSADIWSFGCMVIEMLSGKVPWTNHTAKFSQIIGYISSGIHPPFPPNLTKQCTFFLQACLDPVPTKRLQAIQLLKHRFIDRNSTRKTQSSKNTTKNSPTLGVKGSVHNLPLQSGKKQLRQGSRNTLYDIQALDVEDIEDQDFDNQYYSQRKNTQSYPRNNISPYDSQVKQKMSHHRKMTKNQPYKKGTNKIISQINELDRLEAEINEVSVDEEEILKDRYYVKKTSSNLKKSRQLKAKGISKTSTALKNTEDNILSVQNSYNDIYGRSNTQMTHQDEAINTMIARAERDRYLEQQKIFQKIRSQQKQKWEQQLKEGAQMLKKQFTSRYVIPKV